MLTQRPAMRALATATPSRTPSVANLSKKSCANSSLRVQVSLCVACLNWGIVRPPLFSRSKCRSTLSSTCFALTSSWHPLTCLYAHSFMAFAQIL